MKNPGQEKRARRRSTPEDCEVNARRVRDAYRADPRVRELSAERGRRYRERQAAASHEDALTCWVAAVAEAEGATP